MSVWLVIASALCAGASYALDRFGFEACHRGLPLATLSVGIPVVGVACALWSMFHRTRMWATAVKAALLLANLWQLAAALLVLAGAGFAACA